MRTGALSSVMLVGMGLLTSGTLFAQTKAQGDSMAAKQAEWTPVPPNERAIATTWGKETALLRQAHLLSREGAVFKPGFTSNLLVGRDGNKVPVQSVRVEQGRVDAILVPQSEERGVLLSGPDAIAAIATHGRVAFSVTKQEVLVQVFRGTAKVGHRGIFKDLEPGTIRIFDRATGKSRDEQPAPSPAVQVKSGLGLAISGEATMRLVVPEDGVFCVGVADEAHRAVAESQCRPGREEVTFKVPGAGTYYAVARRLGAGDMEGEKSPPTKTMVLGLAVGQAPPERGIFLLEPLERLRLQGTEGLEMRFGAADRFVPATKSVGLSQNRATEVEFRDPRIPDQVARLKLAPKIGSVQTSIGPARARWPGPPAKITVAVKDGTGRLLPESDDLRLKVSVNSEEVKASFHPGKAGLVATIPPQSGEGPWIVRLTVVDGKNRLLARDILEVLGPKKEKEREDADQRYSRR